MRSREAGTQPDLFAQYGLDHCFDEMFDHIRVAVGRDYGDVPPTRGVFRGEAASELAVLVTVSLAAAPIAHEHVLPITTCVSTEASGLLESFDDVLQQQQQQ